MRTEADPRIARVPWKAHRITYNYRQFNRNKGARYPVAPGGAWAWAWGPVPAAPVLAAPVLANQVPPVSGREWR